MKQLREYFHKQAIRVNDTVVFRTNTDIVGFGKVTNILLGKSNPHPNSSRTDRPPVEIRGRLVQEDGQQLGDVESFVENADNIIPASTPSKVLYDLVKHNDADIQSTYADLEPTIAPEYLGFSAPIKLHLRSGHTVSLAFNSEDRTTFRRLTNVQIATDDSQGELITLLQKCLEFVTSFFVVALKLRQSCLGAVSKLL